MLIAGNWKMNPTPDHVVELLQGIKSSEQVGVETAVFPPFVYLPAVQSQLQNTSIAWGAQTVSQHVSGAYTGEVSAEMLHAMGCKYVIIGHSERRQYHGENNADTQAQILAALSKQIIPILCVGETLTQREFNQTLSVIAAQLNDALDAIHDQLHPGQLVIAYEPVWAIGTGKVATPEQAQEVHAAIRQKMHALFGESGQTVLLLYGGSVNAGNCDSLFQQPDINGALVGGASLKPSEFNQIIKAATQACFKKN